MTKMDTQRWEQAQAIFAAVADLPSLQTNDAILNLCGADSAMMELVQGLVEEDAKRQLLLDSNVVEIVGHSLGDSPATSHLRALVRTQIGPYRLLRLLGEGGMGVVYLAERTDIGGLVAIKLLRDAWLSPMRRERFDLEQHTLVKLNHPAIARIYDAGVMQDSTPWFVMEFADGRPLTEYLRERGASTREDLNLFRRVCEAVLHAHGRAVIHLDLKPSNILVTTEGQVKLLDFGIAKQLDHEMEQPPRTIDGLRLMTPEYAAPEQLSGATVGVFTDVYSLGVLLYQILTGKLPVSAESQAVKAFTKPSAIIRASEIPGARSELSRREWEDLDVLCMTALEVEPEQRYRSVDAFIRDIAAYLDGRVLEARPASAFYTFAKFARRNRIALTGAGVSTLVLAGATLLFTVRLAHARDAAVLETKRTERIQQFMQDMLGGADVEAAPSTDLKVVTLLDRALNEADSLQADLPLQVKLYQMVGSMYSRLAKYTEADQTLSKALEKARTLGDAQNGTVAAILVQLATVRGDRGELKDAKANIEEASRISLAHHSSQDDPVQVQIQIAKARLNILSGEYKMAIETLTPISLNAGRSSGASLYDIRDSLSMLAEAQLYSAHYDLAEAAGRKAIELDKRLFGDSHPQTGADTINLASTMASEGRFSEAEPLYRHGIDVMKTWYGPDHPDVITASSILGRILVSEKKNDEAKAILDQVLRMQQTVYPATHERIAFTLDALAELAERLANYSQAETYQKQAVDIYQGLYGSTNPRTAAAKSNLGDIYSKELKYAQADQTLHEAVTAYESLPPGSNYVGLTHGRWGRVLLRLRKYREAEQELTAADKLLKKLSHPPAGEINNVKSDLVALYMATHQPQKAEHYRVELPSIHPTGTASRLH